MRIDPAVIPVTMIFPLAVPNVVFAPIWGQKRLIKGIFQEIRPKTPTEDRQRQDEFTLWLTW